MGKITDHRRSKVTQINIMYGGEKISFNLMRELRINDEIINDELKSQPSKYGFLLMLHKKLLTEFETLKAKRSALKGRLFYHAKENMTGSAGRPLSDDLAKAYVEKHKDYRVATLACIKAKDDADTIYSCVKAFEQRKDLIQSISSNIRNEK